jgi:hypothetical protein
MPGRQTEAATDHVSTKNTTSMDELRVGGPDNAAQGVREVKISGNVRTSHQIHLAGVNLENVSAGTLIGVGELDLSVNAPRPDERVVEDIEAIRGHQHLDAGARLETIKLGKSTSVLAQDSGYRKEILADD